MTAALKLDRSLELLPDQAKTKPTRPRTDRMAKRIVSTDTELFDVGLDFYFGVLDSACGLRGTQRTGDETQPGNSQAIAQERMQTPKPGSEIMTYMHTSSRKLSSKPADTITDKDLAAIAFGRRVWTALAQVPWNTQQLLRRYYESPRALAAMAGGKSALAGCGALLVESDIRAAHQVYLAMLEGAVAPPAEIDRDVSGDATGRAKYRQRGVEPRSAAERKAAERARNKTEHAGSPQAERFYNEDLEAARAARAAEPFIGDLKPGCNVLSTDAYEALVMYFVEGRAEQRCALKRGRFSVAGGSVEIMRAEKTSL